MPSGSVRALTAAVSLAAILAGGTTAGAQGRLDARYAVSLAGIPIGKGAWVIDIADDQYTSAASGATSGLLRVFASGQGSGASRGYIVAGAPVPASFAASITADKKTEEIRMSIVGGAVKDFAITPPLQPNDERIPVTEAHRRGVTDPMSSTLFRVPGRGDMFSPEACPHLVPVFDGRMRYDLQLAYKRLDRVKAVKGYDGPAVVCSIVFSPISGYIPNRAAIKYLIRQRDMEAWLVPISGTRVMVPFRITIPTPLGLGVMEATQFVSSSPRSTTGGSRSQ